MVDPGALQIVERLQQQGFCALLAGGCVRDGLMGLQPKDWDVATDADPGAVMRLFERTIPVGVKFGVVIVVLEEGQYEVARFRRDGQYLDGRRPGQVEFSGPEADAQRRDFTVNGMFREPVTGELIDYVGGREDIERRLIRAIGDPSQRFAEDYLRMLRAVRFAARFSFEIEAETFAAIRTQAGKIEQISAERIRDELTRILTDGQAARGMQLLLEAGLLEVLLPEVAAMDGVGQPEQFHPEGDVWTHVKLALEKLEDPEPTLAWGTLLHDIGKPPTYEESDRIRFNGHDAVGAKMARGICGRLRMSNDDTERICQLIAHHMRFRHVGEMRAGKLKRFLREEYFPELMELHRVDCLACHAQLDLYDFCRERLAAGEEELRPQRLLTGRDLIEMGFPPGRLFREIFDALEEEQLEGRIVDREQAERFVLGQFGDRRS
ncbi:MAG: CCA tRNA nucleotidyltransferase [Gemmatimonadetes bacterium]|jgi:putative nucleotidyltransferase with HDIG domain|nr:CCA tRNA nucleotidyltransferase [Gemmatimonadota bacterium]